MTLGHMPYIGLLDTANSKDIGAKTYNTVEPKNIEALLSTQFEGQPTRRFPVTQIKTDKFVDFGFGKRTNNFAPLLGSGIFTQDGAAWKHSRALLRPQFAMNRDLNFDSAKKSVETLARNIRRDSVVDLQPLFYRLSLETTLFLLFGNSLSSSQNERIVGQHAEFAEAFHEAQTYLSHRGRLGDYYWLANPPKFWRACRITHEFIDQGIRGANGEVDTPQSGTSLQEEKKHRTFIGALLQKTSNEKVVRDQCLALLLAGRDTTACCLSWAFRLLVRHPEVLDKLRAEVKMVIGLGEHATQPTRASLKGMRYLDSFLKEVLRLYPIAPVNGRTAVRTTTLPVGGGPEGQSPFLVRKGEVVGYSVYAMHRRKDLYGEDALEFRPERWEDGTLLRRVGFGYLPFNGGPRVCLGQDYALSEIGYAVVRLIQKFPNMKMPDDEPVEVLGQEKQALTLVLAPGNGCRVLMRS
ncbi:cytochrome P450 52A11 [Stemphylium lycopersici]|nr:cytochrome P450 52A11 [Stemphylium lycopersici]